MCLLEFNKNIKMKKTSVLVALIVLGIGVLWWQTPSKTEKDSLTIVSFGGAYSASQKKHMLDPFAKQSGIEVISDDYSGGIAELKAQVESNNVTWDVLDIEYIDVERACSEGLLEVIDKSILADGNDGTPAKNDFTEEAYNASECAVGNIIWSIIYAYRGDLKTKPKTIADFFDINKIPGKRGMRKRPQINLEWALIADGVPRDKVYQVLSTPAGVKRAFAKLDTIKSKVVWFESWSQAPQLLSDGSVALSQSANGRIYRAIVDDKQNLTIVWDGHFYDLDGWAIPKGSKNKSNALKFIAFSTQTEPLAGMQDVAYGVTRKSSEKLLRNDVKPHLPSSHLGLGVKVDTAFWADNAASLSEQFSVWLLK